MKWLVGGVLQDESLFSTTHSLSARRTRSILTLESVQKQDSKVQCQVTFADVTVQSDEADLVVFGREYILIEKYILYLLKYREHYFD